MKPCPFCGSTNVSDGSGGFEMCDVGCDECGAATEWYPTIEEARAAWNARPIEDALLEALEDCVKALEMFYGEAGNDPGEYLCNSWGAIARAKGEQQ